MKLYHGSNMRVEKPFKNSKLYDTIKSRTD